MQEIEETNNAAVQVDYRDNLRELLERVQIESGLTRYKVCHQANIETGTLSNVLAKRRHFSLEKLERILAVIGYELAIVKICESYAGETTNN